MLALRNAQQTHLNFLLLLFVVTGRGRRFFPFLFFLARLCLASGEDE